MDEVLGWALENESRVFGRKLWRPYAESESLVAFECIVLAVEEAKAHSDEPERQKAIVCRKARNLLRDHLRRRFGLVRGKDGFRRFKYSEIPFGEFGDDPPEAENRRCGLDDVLLQTEEYVGEGLDPVAVHAALRENFPPAQVRLFELTVAGLSSRAIGLELGLDAAAVRKRWQRVRPEIARCIAEVTGLEEAYVARLLGARRKLGAGSRCSQGRKT